MAADEEFDQRAFDDAYYNECAETVAALYMQHGLTLEDLPGDYETILEHACKSGFIIILDALVAAGLHLPLYMRQAVIKACQGGKSAVVEWLIVHGLTLADVIAFDEETGASALHLACGVPRNPSILQNFLTLGVTLEHLRAYDNEALRRACKVWRVDDRGQIVSTLLAQGLTVADLHTNNNEFLRSLCRNGALDSIQAFLAHGLTVEDLRANDNELVQILSKRHALDCLQTFVAHGLTRDDLCSNHNAALRMACHRSAVHIVHFLLTYGITQAEFAYDDHAILRAACNCPYSGHIAVIQAIINAAGYESDIVAKYIKKSADLEKLTCSQPEPAFEDLVKPAALRA